MDWSLHTRKACATSADLKVELEAVDAMHEKSRVKAALLKDLEPEPRMPGLADQIASAVGLAVRLAEDFQKTGRGPFHASVGGTFDGGDLGDGSPERVYVHVDVAPPEP